MLFVTPGNDATQTQGCFIFFLRVLDVSLCVPVSMGLFICGIIVFLEVNLDEIIVAQSRLGIPARDSRVLRRLFKNAFHLLPPPPLWIATREFLSETMRWCYVP